MKKRMRVDWGDGESYGVLVPWTDDELDYMKGKTHYYDADLDSHNKTKAISAAVKRYSYDAEGETPWPAALDETVLFNVHRKTRDRTWRKLYAKGYRVVRLKVRADNRKDGRNAS